MALTMTPSAAAATRAVPVEKAGVGSAVLNSARQVGGTIGIAVMGAIVASQVGGTPDAGAFMDGFESALLVAAGIAVVGAIVAFALVRPHEGAGEAAPASPSPRPSHRLTRRLHRVGVTRGELCAAMRGRRAIHSPVGQVRLMQCAAAREGGHVGGTEVSPHARKTPPAAAPGAFSVRGDPWPGRRAGERWLCGPATFLPAPVAESGGDARATDLASDRVRCGPDYRSRVRKSQVVRSSDFGYPYLTGEHGAHPPSGGSVRGCRKVHSDGHERDRHEHARPGRRHPSGRARARAPRRRRAHAERARRRAFLEGVRQPDRARQDASDRGDASRGSPSGSASIPGSSSAGVSTEERTKVEALLARAEALSEAHRDEEAVAAFREARSAVEGTWAPSLELRALVGEAWALQQHGEVTHADGAARRGARDRRGRGVLRRRSRRPALPARRLPLQALEHRHGDRALRRGARARGAVGPAVRPPARGHPRLALPLSSAPARLRRRARGRRARARARAGPGRPARDREHVLPGVARSRSVRATGSCRGATRSGRRSCTRS